MAEPRPTGVDRALTRGHQRTQRFPLAAGTRLRWLGLREDAARGPDRVQRIGLAAQAALAPQPADLEHALTLAAQKACQAGSERARSFDRERPPPGPCRCASRKACA